MRYTAKARMLSFDFLSDDTLYRLPPTQALLFAGMVARADNLGRLPGEPDVLLAYLFFPKQPRQDTAVSDVEGLLSALVVERPPVIAWYRVAGTSYVQLLRWEKHQPGIRPHNRKSSFPAPDDECAVPVVPLGGTTDLFETEPAVPKVQFDLATLVGGVAKQASMQKAIGVFDEDAVHAWAKENGEADAIEWVRFSRWLANTGTTRMDDVLAILNECRKQKPDNPYAYFHPAKPTRAKVVMTTNARAAEAEGEEHKRQDRRALGLED